MRIKVLTEKGKDLATVHIPYERRSFKVTDIQGRTIHPDGTVIPLTTKASDLTDIKTKDFQVNTKVFTLPNVEVGSILEYRLQLRYDDDTVSSPTWEVQQPYFVHKAHYQFCRRRAWTSRTATAIWRTTFCTVRSAGSAARLSTRSTMSTPLI